MLPTNASYHCFMGQGSRKGTESIKSYQFCKFDMIPKRADYH